MAGPNDASGAAAHAPPPQPETRVPDAHARAGAHVDESAVHEETGDEDGDASGNNDAAGGLELSLRDERIRSLVALELPVYATSMERVLESIGGADQLQHTHESKSQFLPVKLRPTEPSCKPLFADLTKTQTILLRVKRTRLQKATGRAATAAVVQAGESGVLTPETAGDAATDADAPRIKAEIVGLVREKYVCEGMADFQYFTKRTFYPTTATSDSAHSVSVNSTRSSAEMASFTPSDPTISTNEIETHVDTSICKGSAAQAALKASLRPYLRVSNERELEMIPEVFSKVDLPLKYEFRQRSGYQPTEVAKKVSSTMTYLNFHDDTPAPAEPKPENPVVRRRPVGANEAVDDHVLRILQDKLAEKPIWLRPKLFVGLDFLERRAARRILRKLCYVFVDGPWRGSWIRMGYDPRNSNDSAKYQVIELRNNRELVHAKVTHPSRKRTKKFSGINPKGPRIVKVTQTSENENAQASKRRRKERFLRGETRRSYLVDASDADAPSGEQHNQQQQQSDGAAAGTGTTGDDRERAGDASYEWDSDENDHEDLAGGDDAVSVTSSTTRGGGGDDDGMNHMGPPSTSTTSSTASSRHPSASSGSTAAHSSDDKTFEIFGVPLTSANVLFQLDEIDDDEVREWTRQFTMLETPSLLGGWFSTHMFLPLREIIRYRIAALVGRSKADLDARRKRIEALKRQALSDYKDQLAKGQNSTENGTDQQNGDGGDHGLNDGTTTRAEDEQQAAFEESLTRANPDSEPSHSSKAPAERDAVAAAIADAGAEEDAEDMDFDEEDEIPEDDEEREEGDERTESRLARLAGNDYDDEDDDEDDEQEASNGHQSRPDDDPRPNGLQTQPDVRPPSAPTLGMVDTTTATSQDASPSHEAMEYSF
uniref:Transcription factor IIIC subunit 5 HTH domain-containing protein n=1 Tax=Globisporangium ultimum (strain ATCC 200006 / CBS 805.95 / DAOM BR144) TaxID=431595 RepID=K3WCM8_GLOUD